METSNTDIEKSFPENLPSGWRARLESEAEKDYFKNLTRFLVSEYNASRVIFPQRKLILRTLQDVDYEKVKVVILGQDPYHGPGQAIGRCFAVPNSHLPKPPSLINIYTEIRSDVGIEIDEKLSDLSGWAEQGVLLLNTVLTVRARQAFSHRDQGWENFTDQIIRNLNERDEPIIFILWGAAAQKKQELITRPHHHFLKSPHPSPLSASRGFFGCKHFSQANALLKEQDLEPIDWGRICA